LSSLAALLYCLLVNALSAPLAKSTKTKLLAHRKAALARCVAKEKRRHHWRAQDKRAGSEWR